ncbi:UDP-glucuronosyltransferase 1A1-like isoform X4 [Hyperolius riggenbachi]|uniref:UDP-glucuronosyltransferase 1A1-like isoform X4 n=1 Tax=Hyperolius riggenbachi TaxID=752182 RepID=UPI0035A2E3D2
MNTWSLCFCAIGFLFFTAFTVTEGGKLLVLPLDGSPWLAMRKLLKNLSQRGHQIVLVVPEVHIHVTKVENVTMKLYPVPYRKELISSMITETGGHTFQKRTILENVKVMYESTVNFTNFAVLQCETLLGNDGLMKYLEDYKFDAMLNDAVYPCGEIVAEHLSLPTVSFTRMAFFGADLEATQSPNPPSYVPRFFSEYTDHMDFKQTVNNFILSYIEYIVCRIFYAPYARLASDFLQREVTVLDLFGRASVWLFRYDFIFEFPRPIMPNMVLIGGINCAHTAPLTQEFEKLVNSSGEHGFVVFSLGSMVSEIPMHKAMDIAEALGSIPQTVIWRYTGPPPSNLEENTHLVKWLPQNDLLAHPKARAFITHAGSHGIYEGICNAVPMVMLPLFGDQMDNAKRIESRGAGITLNVLDMTPDDLTNALKSVINVPSYKENIHRLSDLHLDRPIHPLDLAVYWVEFVMRHKGAPHLRPAAHDLNWIQYHSIDVFAFLLAVLVISLFISIKCCAFTLRCCCGRKSSGGKSKSKSKSKKE